MDSVGTKVSTQQTPRQHSCFLSSSTLFLSHKPAGRLPDATHPVASALPRASLTSPQQSLSQSGMPFTFHSLTFINNSEEGVVSKIKQLRLREIKQFTQGDIASV